MITATDSESSIKAMHNYHDKTLTKRLQTPEREILIDIHNNIARIKDKYNSNVWLLHVPAHTNDTAQQSQQNSNKERRFADSLGNPT